LVYLTGDTNEVMDEIKLEEIYIIGGLVDHNRLK
jgi:tRNA (guanine9-N1)-methyltransferase